MRCVAGIDATGGFTFVDVVQFYNSDIKTATYTSEIGRIV